MGAKKIFSGVQPTGNLHLGNYIGAIKNFVDLQNENNECLFCVVDLHAVTIKQDPRILKKNIRDTAATFLACGIKPKKSTCEDKEASLAVLADLATVVAAFATTMIVEGHTGQVPPPPRRGVT